MESQSGHSYAVDSELHATLAELSQLEDPRDNQVGQESSAPMLPAELARSNDKLLGADPPQPLHLILGIVTVIFLLTALVFFFL